MATYWRSIQTGALAALICALPLLSVAQHDSIRSNQHSIYIGLLGNGVFYSLAYDMNWSVGKTYMSAGIGAGYLPDLDPAEQGTPSASRFTLPIQWNWFYGKKGKLEHGLGLTYASGLNAETNPEIHSDAIWAAIKPIGYRLQKIGGGFFFRVQ